MRSLEEVSKPIRYDASASVTIARPVSAVFEFYRDFENFPSFLGDVMSVEKIGPSLYRWAIAAPFGIKTRWNVRVTEVRENSLIRYQTVSRLPSAWTVSFSTFGQDGTRIHARMTIPFGAAGKAFLGLIGKPPAAEMTSNLNRLKQLFENGSITDLSHSVPGKFVHQRTT